MKQRLVYENVQQKAKYTVPARYCREIGRIMVRWAYYEQQIQRMIWAVSFDGDLKGAALGRLAIREGKPEEQLKLLADTAKVRGISMDEGVFARLKTSVKLISEDRNLLAHGLWTDPPSGGWAVQETRGAWQETKGGPSGKKKVTPEGVLMEMEDLYKITLDIETLISDAKTLQLSLLRS